MNGNKCRDKDGPWTIDDKQWSMVLIDFSNGGGLQGQEFRLDIDRDDICDEELADYIVRDMRLLMVKEVRILKKEIITEKHKR